MRSVSGQAGKYADRKSKECEDGESKVDPRMRRFVPLSRFIGKRAIALRFLSLGAINVKA